MSTVASSTPGNRASCELELGLILVTEVLCESYSLCQTDVLEIKSSHKIKLCMFVTPFAYTGK